MTRFRGLLAAAAVPLLLLGACARPGDAAGSPATADAPVTESATSPDTLMLRVEHRGGFVPPEHLLSRFPLVSVYADGRVITEGPVLLRYPGPALPNVVVGQVSPDTVRQLVDEAVAAGVREGFDFGTPNVADVPSTRISVVTAEGPRSVEVLALREAMPEDPAITVEQRTARKKLADLVERLTRLPEANAAKPYAPATLAALARPYSDPGNPVRSRSLAWPGPALPGPLLGENIAVGCLSLTGAERDAALAAAAKADQITAWTSGGKRWSITFRPLLPDEKDCADLRAKS